MKMKKKLFTALAACTCAVVTLFGLTACSNGSELKFGKEMLKAASQLDILTQLDNGAADIGVMDSVMANHYMNQDGGTYSGSLMLVEGLDLADEEYGIAARKSAKDTIARINEALIALKDTDYKTIAEKYNVDDMVLIDENTTAASYDSVTDHSDWEQIVSSKKIIIGYTIFEPISYEKDGALTGFDVELANAAINYLNGKYGTEIEIEFKLITDWSAKETMLENGTLDLIWNGMTINPERMEAMSISVPYLANKQVAVIRKEDAAKYGTFGAFVMNVNDAVIAVESGSAAQTVVERQK